MQSAQDRGYGAPEPSATAGPLEQILHLCERLHSALSDLTSRVEPILGPQSTPQGIEKGLNQVEPILHNVRRQLRDACSRVEQLAQRVDL
jgi:hypothetical protein